MVNFFGSDGIINSITALFGAGFVLGALMFRKSVANDMMGFPFSVIGSSACSILGYIILDNIFGNLKISFVAGLVGFLLGGFFLASFIGDGEADGGST